MQLTITVRDDTYHRLARRAAAAGTTVEALAAPVLERLAQETAAHAHPAAPPVDLPDDEWKRVFDQLIADAAGRADRYPPDFECDVSREAIYEGCGEAFEQPIEQDHENLNQLFGHQEVTHDR